MFPACKRVHDALGDWTYDQAKNCKYFEWVDDLKKTITNLAVEIFETLGVSADDETFNITVKGLQDFQKHQLSKMHELDKQIQSRPDLSKEIKSFVVDWAPGAEYHYSQKYYLKDGPNTEILRSSFVAVLTDFVTPATFVANKMANIDDKIKIANYSKDIFQYEVECLEKVKKNIASYQNK